jgi:trigger factor
MIRQFELSADPAKVKELIEDIASTYQDPEEVINWYYSENEQLAGSNHGCLKMQWWRSFSRRRIAEVRVSYQDALAKRARHCQG